MFAGDSMGAIDLRLLHVLDGSMASAVEELGYDNKSTCAWSSGANLTHPDLVVKAHLSFIDAGADIILTNTYQANIKRITQKSGSEKAMEVIKNGADLARKAVDMSKKHVYVVGSIGPYATYLGDCSEYTAGYLEDKNFDRKLIKENFETQANALYQNGVRVFAFETIPSIVEAVYAKEVLEEMGCDGYISVVCKDDKHLVNGDKFSELVKNIADSSHVKMIGINCTLPEHIKGLIKSGLPFAKNKGFVVYPNSGERFDGDSKTFYGSPEIDKIVGELEDWIQLGVRVVGGCCRVKPDDIRLIANEMNKLN
ncbi:Homocysteine S-methyltransferase [Aphelenchoides bicaudatus]|nr:Homocysteine S-methyltransferase [Aphelenchoides bicaudatus]